MAAIVISITARLKLAKRNARHNREPLRLGIIARMIHAAKADLPKATAQAVLRLFSLDQEDLDSMHVLAVRNQERCPYGCRKKSSSELSSRQLLPRP